MKREEDEDEESRELKAGAVKKLKRHLAGRRAGNGGLISAGCLTGLHKQLPPPPLHKTKSGG